ncbi:XRE family transcriptional regulator [Leuconostoc citreum]|nr:XRE family transcriptional regulator [Leuconostoc citreum]MCT3062901.1 XRE family transcriptional regulator [Leuconostoc citreum]
MVKLDKKLTERYLIMAQDIMTMLDDQKVSLTDVANVANIGLSTLSTAVKRPVDTWSLRIINGLARALYMQPGELVNRIQDVPFELDVNDQKQTIQGVFISDSTQYKQIKFVVNSTVMEGWQPDVKDIERLKLEAANPNSRRKQRALGIMNGGN